MRCFVDTNIWLYALMGSADDRRSHAARILLLTDAHEFIVSTQVINEVCVNLLRKGGVDEPFVRELTLSFFRRYPVVVVDEGVMLVSGEVRAAYSLSY